MDLKKWLKRQDVSKHSYPLQSAWLVFVQKVRIPPLVKNATSKSASSVWKPRQKSKTMGPTLIANVCRAIGPAFRGDFDDR
jgi:hypothetical protein